MKKINKHQSEAEGKSWLICETAYLAPGAKGCSPIQGLHYASTMGKLINCSEYAKHNGVKEQVCPKKCTGERDPRPRGSWLAKRQRCPLV